MTDTKDNSAPDIRYGHEGHRAFNRQFLPKSTHADVTSGPWLSNEAVARLPPVRREFDKNRDPNRVHMLSEIGQSDNQQRGDQSGSQTVTRPGRGSSMVRQDQPKATMSPPQDIRSAVDNQRFRSRWLAEQRSAAMAEHSSQSRAEHQKPEISPENNLENSPRYHTPKR